MKYFAYGLNTNINSMSARCPAAVNLGPAILSGHEFIFAGFADVILNASNQVHGVLWEITDSCLASLDILEGYPVFYDRKNVLIKHQGSLIRAMTYFMTPGNPAYLPDRVYLDSLLEGYKVNNVPVSQLTQAIKKIHIYNDPIHTCFY